jgi:hypothetical protein
LCLCSIHHVPAVLQTPACRTAFSCSCVRCGCSVPDSRVSFVLPMRSCGRNGFQRAVMLLTYAVPLFHMPVAVVVCGT